MVAVLQLILLLEERMLKVQDPLFPMDLDALEAIVMHVTKMDKTHSSWL